MAKNAGSRVLFGLMVVPCVLLCIISVISFSTFAAQHNKIKGIIADFNKRQGVPRQDYCILFAESLGDTDGDGKNHIALGSDGPCAFAIWGQVSVCFVSVILGTIFTVKAIAGINVLTFLVMLETGFIVLAMLLDFVVAVIITAGLDRTCDSFGTTQNTCERAFLVIPDNHERVQYYPNINASKATAWIGSMILFAIALIHMVAICAYCRHLRRPREATPYKHMGTEEEEDDRKPAVV